MSAAPHLQRDATGPGAVPSAQGVPIPSNARPASATPPTPASSAAPIRSVAKDGETKHKKTPLLPKNSNKVARPSSSRPSTAKSASRGKKDSSEVSSMTPGQRLGLPEDPPPEIPLKVTYGVLGRGGQGGHHKCGVLGRGGIISS